MVNGGTLERRYPESPTHPQQAYRHSLDPEQSSTLHSRMNNLSLYLWSVLNMFTSIFVPSWR